MKEAVEHFLLASGDGEAHHHHRGNEHTVGCVFVFAYRRIRDRTETP